MSALQLAGGIACAAAAAACFDAAVAWQAIEAREVDHSGARLALLGRLIRRPRWLAATALSGMGWPFHLAALGLAPLTVVQPTLAGGLVLLLIMGVRVLGERVGVIEAGGVALIIAGVGVLAWASPERETVVGDPVEVAVAIGALGVLGAIPWLLRSGAPSLLPTLGAGASFAATGLTSKLVSDALAKGDWPAVIAIGALTAGLAALGLADEMAALQRLPATRVAPIVLTVQVVGPVLLAPVVAGEHWSSSPGGGLAIVGGLVVVAAGVIPLASTRAVSRLLTEQG